MKVRFLSLVTSIALVVGCFEGIPFTKSYAADTSSQTASTIPYRYTYGDTKLVSSISDLPEEWIITAYDTSSEKYTVKFVGNAPYGKEEEVYTYSEKNTNWVKTDLSGHKIRYIGGAQYGSTEIVAPDIKIPADWVATEYNRDNSTMTIKYLNGAKRGDVVAANFYTFWEMPEGWIVTQYDNNTQIGSIKYLGSEKEIHDNYSFGQTVPAIFIQQKKIPVNFIWNNSTTLQYVANGSYGAQAEVEFFYYYSEENLPEGWVLTNESKSSSGGTKGTIKCLSGASYGSTAQASIWYAKNPLSSEVNNKNSLPEGWVITDFSEDSKQCTIKYIAGAPYNKEEVLKDLPGYLNGHAVTAMKPTYGWIITSRDSSAKTYTVKCIEGAKYKDQLSIYVNGFQFDWTKLLPYGWMFVSSVGNDGFVTIKYINGAPIGTIETVLKPICSWTLFLDTVPAGWVDIETKDSFETLKYTGDIYNEVGKKIDFNLKDISGNTVKLSDLKGKNVLLVVASSDYNLNSIFKEQIPDLEIFSVSPNPEEVESYINHGILRDPGNSFAYTYASLQNGNWNTLYWPIYLFIDKNSTLVSKKIRISESQALAEAKRLFGSKDPLPQVTPSITPTVTLSPTPTASSTLAPTPTTPQTQIAGDLNGDKKVNSTDLSLCKRYLLGLVTDLPVNDDYIAADLNLDKKINSTDYSILKRYVLGNIDRLPYIPQSTTPSPTAAPTPTLTSAPTPTPTATPTPTPTAAPTATPTPTPGSSDLPSINDAKSDPDSVFTNESTDVVFTAEVAYDSTKPKPEVTLNSSDEGGSTIEKLGAMNDDGIDGDAVANDNIYSIKRSMLYTSVQTAYFTVSAAQDTAKNVSYPIKLYALNLVTDTQLSANTEFQNNELQKFTGLINSKGLSEAQKSILNELSSNPDIDQAGISESGDSIWFQYKDGTLGAISPKASEDTKGSGSISNTSGSDLKFRSSISGSMLNDLLYSAASPFDKSDSTATTKYPRIPTRKVLLLSPMLHDFKDFDDHFQDSTNPGVYDIIKGYKYDNKNVFPDDHITFLSDGKVTIDFLRNNLSNYGIISISSHGDTLYQDLRNRKLWKSPNGQVGFYSGQQASQNEPRSIREDLSRHRLATSTFMDKNPDGTRTARTFYFVLPSFISSYCKNKYQKSIVYMSTCRSAYNTSLSDAFLNTGALTFLGYSNYVDSAFARKTGADFFKEFLSNTYPISSTTGASFVSGLRDTSNPPAEFKMFGEKNLKPPLPIVNLGTVGDGESMAYDINNKGQVVGASYIGSDQYPFLWDDEVITKLNSETSWAGRINDKGQICLSSEKKFDEKRSDHIYSKGFLWQNGTIKSPGEYIRYMDINDKGQIVGFKADSLNYNLKGFLLQNGTYTDLGNFIPVDINNNGQIIGYAMMKYYQNDDMQIRSFLYQNGTFKDIGTLNKNARKSVSFANDSTDIFLTDITQVFIRNNTTFGQTLAQRINDKGQIVGDSYIDDGTNEHAFLWENGVMKDLGILGGQDGSSVAFDINNDGLIVGNAKSSDGLTHPFLIRNGKMENLSDTGTFGIVQDRVSTGRAINELGQIAGFDFGGEAVLWTP